PLSLHDALPIYEGGSPLLSNSISLALITTAAGLIVAIPAIAIYFYLKRSIKGTATIMEEELEHALTVVYIQASPQNDKQKLLTVGESDISQNDFVDEESDQNDENTPFDKE